MRSTADGGTAFNLIQHATGTGEGSLIFFLFDLLHLDGENLTALPLVERKTRLASLLNDAPESLRYNDHQIGRGPAFHRLACEHGLEGIVSKRVNGRYEPDRRTWRKIKCLNREELLDDIEDAPEIVDERGQAELTLGRPARVQ